MQSLYLIFKHFGMDTITFKIRLATYIPVPKVPRYTGKCPFCDEHEHPEAQAVEMRTVHCAHHVSFIIKFIVIKYQ